MNENSVYNNLHNHAFSILKSYIYNNESEKNVQDFATDYLKSSQVTGDLVKDSIYHKTVSSYIANNVNKDILQKNVDELSNSEMSIYENAKNNIDSIIKEEIDKFMKVPEKVEEQKKEVEKAKEELNVTSAKEIEDNKGNTFVKFDGENKNEPLVAEKVGNTTVADMIDKDSSFIVDGSGIGNIESVKKSDEIVNNIKNDRITNAFSMENINTSNNDNLNNDQKEEIGILKSSNLDLDGTKYDTTTGLAFTNDGSVLDTSVNSNGDIKINDISNGVSMDLPKSPTIDEKIRNMSKTQLVAYISELEEKGVSREEASATLSQIDAYKTMTEETKKNLLDNFHSINEANDLEMKNSKQLTKTLATNPNIPNTKAGIASSIIISFVAGIISGVVIMLLVYFFLTH